MSSGEPKTCPLCQADVESGDALQLHYLTSCSGYDKETSEQPRSKLSAQSHPGDSGTTVDPSPPAAQPVAAPRLAKSSVQFMWQPLSEISYRTVTLLASFDVGTVEMHLDAEGGHYASDQVQISNGSFEGQLVIGDSFVHPVKKFTIEKDGDIVVLQFDVSPEEQQGSLYGSSTRYYGGSQYGTGQMYTNPSYGSGGTVSYSNPMYDQSAGQYGRQGGRGGQYSSKYSDGSSSSYRREHGVSNYNNQGNGYGSERSNYHPPTTAASQHTAQRIAERLKTPGAATSNAGSSSSQLVAGATSLPRSSQTATNSQDQPSASQVIEPINIPISSGQISTEKQYTVRGDSGFNVGDLQHTVGSTTSQELITLRQQLEEVTKERDSLKQTSERVNAQWEGRVRRLQQQLGQQSGDDPPPLEDIGQTAVLEEAQATIMSLESELTKLRRQVNDRSQTTRGKQEAERELVELRDRNTALEQQMMEYLETIKDQNKYIQSLSSTSKVNDVEVLRYQQEAIHLTEFAKKQQLENEEALSSLKKKIDFASDVADQSQKIHLLNVNLSGELEDYRTQTKRLLAELRQKDDEVINLRQALAEKGASGSDHHDLELASMKEKCDAWQEEVERLSEFKEQVQQLHEENIHLTSTNDELTSQIQSVLNENEKKQAETAHKLSEYDTLMSRFVQLQATRVNLERELQPLRQERADILTKNAELLEGSQAQNYVKLKQEHKELKKYCEDLQRQLEEQRYLISAHQDTNVEMQQKLDQATDPERLQSIRERMERYKQERDTARKQVEDLKLEQQKTTEHLSAFAGSSEQRLETAEQQMHQLNQEFTHLSAKASDYESRMRRYRDERNKLTTANRQLQEQLATLQDTVNNLLAQSNPQDIDASYLESMASLNYTAEHELVHSPTREHEPSSPLAEYQPHQYTTDDDQYVEYSGEAGSPVGMGESSLSVEGKSVRSKKSSSEPHSSRDGSSGTPKKGKDQHFFDIAEVKTKNAMVSMYIQKPTSALNPKHKPRVVVKRNDDLFEAGTLMFVGSVGGKELAGVQMDLRQTKSRSSSGGASLSAYSDGTYKDGKRYFKCDVGFGLYVPLSRVYIEMESAAV